MRWYLIKYLDIGDRNRDRCFWTYPSSQASWGFLNRFQHLVVPQIVAVHQVGTDSHLSAFYSMHPCPITR